MNVWEHLDRSSVSRQKFLTGVRNVRLILCVTLLLGALAGGSSQKQNSDEENGGKSY